MIPHDTDDALVRLLERGRARAEATDPAHARLWQALSTATAGGKRFRPALVTAAHRGLGGTRVAASLEVGAAVEMLHTAFVIHDDVIDGDDVRRGRPNVCGLFRADAIAAGASVQEADELSRTAGILAGDLALAAAIRAVASCGASRGVTERLLDLFDAALHTSAAGELADVRLSLDLTPGSLTESLVMEEQKTSAYSFALPLQAGALLADADTETTQRLGEAGCALGISFQLADDLLGVFGEPTLTGKSATSDLRSRKQTPLLAHARGTAQWPDIRTYVGRDLADAELADVRRLLVDSGSRAFVEDLAASRHHTARQILSDLGLGEELADLATLPANLRGDGVAA